MTTQRRPRGPEARKVKKMRGLYQTPWSLTKELVVKFFDDSPFEMSAALSFYTVLSLSPLLLIVVAAAGLVWGKSRSAPRS